MTLSPTSSKGSTGPSGITRTVYGYNTIGGTTDALGSAAYKQVFKTITTTADGLLSSIDVYCQGTNTNVAHLAPAVFNDNAGAIGRMIALGHFAETLGSATIGNAVMATSPRWVALPVGAWLTAGTYWLCVGAGDGCTLFYDASGADFTSAAAQTWLLTASDSTGGATPSNSSRQYSIRANLLS